MLPQRHKHEWKCLFYYWLKPDTQIHTSPPQNQITSTLSVFIQYTHSGTNVPTKKKKKSETVLAENVCKPLRAGDADNATNCGKFNLKMLQEFPKRFRPKLSGWKVWVKRVNCPNVTEQWHCGPQLSLKTYIHCLYFILNQSCFLNYLPCGR